MAEAKKGRGCFFYGCLTLIVIVIAGVAALVIGGRMAYMSFVRNYTSTNSVAVAPMKLPEKDGAQVVQRLQDFTTRVQKGQPAEPLELNSDQLDAAVRLMPGDGNLRDFAHLAITNDEIQAEISVPLETFMPGWKSLKGRYFNGKAAFVPDVRNGTLTVDLHSLEKNGQKLPDQAIAQFKQNLRWQPQAGQEGADLLNNLEKVEIKDGKLVLFPKAKASDEVKEPVPTPGPK